MKICDIAQFYSPLSGGVKRYLSDKARFLQADPGSQHVLIVPSDQTATRRTPTGTVHEIRSPRLIGSQSYRLLLARRQILEIVRQERPDLIEVGDPYRTAWIGLEAGRELGIPVVAYYHSDFPRALGRTVQRFAGGSIERLLSGPFQRYVVRLYNRMAATVVSSRRLQFTLGECGIARVLRVPLGTDVKAFQPQASRDGVRRELGLAEGERMLLFVGRLGREKNIRHLLAALERLPASCPPRRLVLVGDGELREFVRAAARQRRDLVWVPYCESVPRLAAFYSAADLFVHPGCYETFGIVALEAQACGTPVLAVRGGGVEEALVDEPPALAADGSPAGLAAAIDEWLRDSRPPTERALRHQRIETRFSLEASFARLFALYRHVIAGRPVREFSAEGVPCP